MKVTSFVLATSALLAFAVPANAIDLGASAGGATASTSASAGSSGASGSVSARLGNNLGDVDIDPGTLVGNTPATVDGIPIDRRTGQPIPLVGRDVLSSDRVHLGRITALKQSGGGCPLMGLKTNSRLPVAADTVWLRMNTCSTPNGPIKLSMSSGRFIEMTSR